MKIFSIRRKTRKMFINNSWSVNGGWYAYVTSVDLMFLGMPVYRIYEYYISYRGEFCEI